MLSERTVKKVNSRIRNLKHDDMHEETGNLKPGDQIKPRENDINASQKVML
jgi:hypothetical protein